MKTENKNMLRKKKRNIILRLALACHALALTPLTLSAQEISAVRDLIDCGSIMYDTPVTVTFELQNKGRRTLNIKSVKPGCGCVAAEYPHEGIPPGTSFTISATYDARQMGHFSKDIAVYSNASDRPFFLTIQGQVAETVTEFMGNFDYTLAGIQADNNNIEFDNVNRGERPVGKIRIHNTTGHDISPTVMHLPAYLSATVSPTTIHAGRQGVVTLTLDSRKLRDYGLTQTSVYLGLFPGDKVAPGKEITVSSVLLPDFRDMTETQLANAPLLTLSQTEININFSGKKKRTESITLGNTGRTTLDITSLQMFTAGLSVKLNKTHIPPGESAELKITADAKALKATRTKPRVLMITNDPDHPKVVININSDI